MRSFYFETLVLNVFDGAYKINTIREGAKQFFDKCSIFLHGSCPSPTGHGPALDEGIDWSVKQKIATAMASAAQSAGYALTCETKGNVRDALGWWRQVFGSEFPAYG